MTNLPIGLQTSVGAALPNLGTPAGFAFATAPAAATNALAASPEVATAVALGLGGAAPVTRAAMFADTAPKIFGAQSPGAEAGKPAAALLAADGAFQRAVDLYTGMGDIGSLTATYQVEAWRLARECKFMEAVAMTGRSILCASGTRFADAIPIWLKLQKDWLVLAGQADNSLYPEIAKRLADITAELADRGDVEAFMAVLPAQIEAYTKAGLDAAPIKLRRATVLGKQAQGSADDKRDQLLIEQGNIYKELGMNREAFVSYYVAKNVPADAYGTLLPLRDAIDVLNELADAAKACRSHRREFDILMDKGALQERLAEESEDAGAKRFGYRLAADDYLRAYRSISKTVAYFSIRSGTDFRLDSAMMELRTRAMFAESEARSKSGEKNALLDGGDPFFNRGIEDGIRKLFEDHGLFNSANRDYAEKLAGGDKSYLDPVLDYVAGSFHQLGSGLIGIEGEVLERLIRSRDPELLRQMQDILDVTEATALKIIEMAAGTSAT